jgi:hypothetical protein
MERIMQYKSAGYRHMTVLKKMRGFILRLTFCSMTSNSWYMSTGVLKEHSASNFTCTMKMKSVCSLKKLVTA